MKQTVALNRHCSRSAILAFLLAMECVSATSWADKAPGPVGIGICSLSLLPIRDPNEPVQPPRDELDKVAVECSKNASAPVWFDKADDQMGRRGASPPSDAPVVGHALPMTIAFRNSTNVSVAIYNPGSTTLMVRASVKDWYQDAFGQDVLTASENANVSPERLALRPGETRELNLRLPASKGIELAFRVVVQQFPENSGASVGPIVSITQSFPVFAVPPLSDTPRLRARRIDPRHLLISNDGGRHARLADVRSTDRVIARGFTGYALAHSSTIVSLMSPFTGGTIEVDTDQGQHRVEVR